MTRMKILLAASVTVLGVTLAVTPASAQSSCDLNGVPQPAALGTRSFDCGDINLGSSSGDYQTLIGEVLVLSGDGATVVGSNAAAGFGFGSSPFTFPTFFSQTAVGSHAFAVGEGTVAIGDQAVAGIITPFLSGFDADPVTNGTAIGSHALVSANNGTAVGMSAQATADSATAVGQNATASGTADTAMGVDSTASGGQSAAYGFEAEAFGNHSTALGAQATATVADSTAVGFGADATATGAVALGNQTTASHANSVAIGNGTSTTAANQVNVGGRTIGGVAAGVAATDAVNVSQLTAATGGITTNITALQAADAGFDTRIDTLEAVALSFDEDLDRIDDRASAGTAAAVALSGAMFLPGKSFNLTGNVGSYRGAHAAALQFGALVSENIAVNAGVAHGFNKGGKTALRAGLTIGW